MKKTIYNLASISSFGFSVRQLMDGKAEGSYAFPSVYPSCETEPRSSEATLPLPVKLVF